MAFMNIYEQFVEDLGKGVHNLDTNDIRIALTNHLPVAADNLFADIQELAAGGGYNATGEAVAGLDFEQVAGVAKLAFNDVVWTGIVGGFGPCQYAVLYNNTPANGRLIGWWDRGSAVTVLAGDTLTFNGTDNTNMLQIS